MHRWQRLRYLQNYTTLKLSVVAIVPPFSLRHLQNYTTLKRHGKQIYQRRCLRHLQNYTTLKPQTQNTSSAFQSFSSHHQV